MKKMTSLLLAALLLFGMTACGGAAEPAEEPVDLSAVYQSFTETLPEMMVLDETTMMNFLGIDAADCNQVIAAVCANGLRTDEVWLIEAKDEAALERLTKLVDSRIVSKEDETVSYSPDQYEIVKKCVVINKGLYLAFLVSPDVQTLQAAFEEAVN